MKADTIAITIVFILIFALAFGKPTQPDDVAENTTYSENTERNITAKTNYSERLGREVTEDELYYLNMITYMESGNQPYKGQVAVAAVVLNRLEANFGDCIWNVLFYPGAFEPCQNGQFVNRNGKVVYSVPESHKEQISNAVWDALSGEDPTNGAYYFYNPDACSEKQLALREDIGGITFIGDHVFYSEWN